MAETVTPTAGRHPALRRAPAGSARLVHLRLGQLRVPDHRHHRVPRPVPDHRRRDGGRLRAGRGLLRRLRLPAGHHGRRRVLLPVPDLAVGVPHRVRAAGDRGDRRPVGAQEAAARRCSRSPAPAPPSRWPSSPATATCSAGRCSWSPTSPSAPRSWSTTRSCRSSAAPTNATASPAAAGRWATSAAACCWRSTSSRSPCSTRATTRNAPLDLARWSIVSAGVWWAVFTLVPLRWLRERPSAGGRWPAAATCSPTGSGSSAAPCARSRRTR